MISQLGDTIIVNTIFLGWGLGLPWAVVGKINVSSYLFKLLIALLDMPFIYLGMALMRRYGGIEEPVDHVNITL